MGLKLATWKIKGMQRDLAESAFNSLYAYENMNMRIIALDSNTTLALVNEKGTKNINIPGIGYDFQGIPIGNAVINNQCILFTTTDTKDSNKDKIYKISYINNELVGELIYEGDLNFNSLNPIETLTVFENENIQKVYWTDGENQPRVINVSNEFLNKNKNKFNNTYFDFIPSLNLNENVSIEKNITAHGEFASGVIQYCFSYFNKYGLLSNIFYISPLYYCSLYDRGLSADNKSSNSFVINILNLDHNFDYLRIYSIHRSSEDNTPYCKCVTDIQITNDINNITYEDNNLNGYEIDPTELLYLGGEEITAKTFTVKDDVLFLGNLKLKRNIVNSDLKNELKNNIRLTESVNRDNPIYENRNLNSYYHHTNLLNYNSNQIKTFKQNEVYRLGIQLQLPNGKWTESIFLNDYKVKSHSDLSFNSLEKLEYRLPKIVGEFTQNILNDINSQGYIKIRPVIVYPKLQERNCICQGVLCPTVFNVGNRYNNAPFVQSSWYARPDAPAIEIDNSLLNQDNLKGKWVEYKHYSSLSYCTYSNAEILCNYHTNKGLVVHVNNPYIKDIDDKKIQTFISKFSDLFFVDKSIVTFHSPDIEFNKELKSFNGFTENTNLKLRIIGKVNFTSNISDIDITTNGSGNYTEDCIPYGFYKNKIGATMLMGPHAWKSCLAMPFWFDLLYQIKNNGNLAAQQAFVVYPWHSNGSLNNILDSNQSGYTTIKRKVISNLKVSSFNTYLKLDLIINFNNGISGVYIFDSDEISLIKIKAPLNSDLTDLNYYGNVDLVINNRESYPIMISNTDDLAYLISNNTSNKEFSSDLYSAFVDNWRGAGDIGNNKIYSTISVSDKPVRIKYKSSPHAVIAFNYEKRTNGDVVQTILPKIDEDFDTGYFITPSNTALPNNTFWNSKIKTRYKNINPKDNVFDFHNLNQDNSAEFTNGFLWLAELYNDDVNDNTRFGGLTEEAFENNEWLPAGPALRIDYLLSQTTSTNSAKIEWLEGDTYYQRYDHLKTKSFNKDDLQSLIEIISFMCETRVNLDGRYDRNRGLESNLHITSENFNLLNSAYNQKNNYFVYHGLNSNLYYPDNFINTVTWTKTKNNSELIDAWCNITLANTLNLEGNKGELKALRKYNNNILAFQDKSLSLILFNENVLITTTEGVPVEIANSGKVQGFRTITNQIGCSNKHSICETPNQLYFIDSNTKSLYGFNGLIKNISTEKGFLSYFNNRVDFKEWNPKTFDNFILLYDSNTQDVYIINKNECLSFNENLNEFSSFYSYENTPYIINLQNVTIALRLESVFSNDNYHFWLLYEGSYNSFFKLAKPYYTTIIANTNPLSDKIFNQVEFRADTWNENELTNKTFDTLSVWNEYLKSTTKLNFELDKVTNLKKKFRIWRANIPRSINVEGNLNLSVDTNVSDYRNDVLNKLQTSNIHYNRDRIRNPWSYILLSKERNLINEKTILHDMTINYFE